MENLYDVSALQAQAEGRVHIFHKDNAVCCPANSTDSSFEDHPYWNKRLKNYYLLQFKSLKPKYVIRFVTATLAPK